MSSSLNEFTILGQIYQIVEKINGGSHGEVYKTRKNQTEYVVKVMDLSECVFYNDKTKGIREVYVLRELSLLNHASILHYEASEVKNGKLLIATNFVDGRPLEKEPFIPEDQVKKIAQNLINAVHFIHSHRFVHRDLKWPNILWDGGEGVTIADFGLARHIDDDLDTSYNIGDKDMLPAEEDDDYLNPIKKDIEELAFINNDKRKTHGPLKILFDKFKAGYGDDFLQRLKDVESLEFVGQDPFFCS